ncbi:MAG TPA: aminotransferase class IV [Geothrix sp.]|nr:aminotransferase class IV [Geothrix sp.]
MISWRSFGPGALANAPRPGQEIPCPRTALRLEVSGPQHLNVHLARLEAGALALGNSTEWLGAAGQSLLEWLHIEATVEPCALRLQLHPDQGLLIAELGPLPRHRLPYHLVAMEHPLASQRNETATRHKGLCGPWSAQVLDVASQMGAQDALLIWPDGTLAETAIAALGLEVEDILYVPPAEGRVTSIAEALDLPAWAAGRGLQLRQEPIPKARIRDGKLWCMNSLRGIWPAKVAGDV